MAKNKVVDNYEPKTENEVVLECVNEIGVISEGTKIVGDINTNGHLAIDGTVEGNLDAKGNVVITGSVSGVVTCNNLMVEDLSQKMDVKAKGQVVVKNEVTITGQIECGGLSLQGKLNGNVVSTGLVTLSQTAAIEGNITAGSLGIEPGAKIKGTINIG